MLTDKQKLELAAPLDRQHVKTRTQSGRELSYLEGWHVIDVANHVFGFDGWSRETISAQCVADEERAIGNRGDKGFGVSYVAKVRVTIIGQPGIVREGTGAGHGIDRSRGLAHESAIKEAETDALKRAFMTFGYRFGLALYDKEQANVVDVAVETSNAAHENEMAADEISESEQAYIERFAEQISRCKKPSDVVSAWKNAAEKRAELKISKGSAAYEELARLCKIKTDNIEKAKG